MIRNAYHVRLENLQQADGAQTQVISHYYGAKLHQLQISIGRYLAFTSGGTRELVPGSTITGAVSGATARIGEITIGTGSWDGGNAAGSFLL